MFTGIIEETGILQNIKIGTVSAVLTIQAAKVLEETRLGDSIAVNGICLTVTELEASHFKADVMAETLRRTDLGSLRKGSRVNLERALTLSRRLGGHIVSGHIDGTGVIKKLEREKNAVWVTVHTDAKQLRYIIEKGSIAIDGISLTVAYVDEQQFKVSVIPHTGEETTLLRKKAGDTVNLECDIIGKYVEKLLLPAGSTERVPNDVKPGNSGNINMDFLISNGFL